MPRVVPSQVRELINKTFPPASLSSGSGKQIGHNAGAHLRAVLVLAEKIPDELLVLRGEDYNNYVTALEIIRHTLSQWIQGHLHLFLPLVGNRNAVLVVYEALTLCPDESTAPATATLMFISDPELRDSIGLDISAADRDLVNAEWKGATVLAGSATEALLLWAVGEAEKQSLGTLATTRAALITAGELSNNTNVNPEWWGLHEFIKVAHYIGLIEDNTAEAARLCKDFRNLIHPGRAARLAQICDRGTAHLALAAVALVVRDLARWVARSSAPSP
jgi:hypothetical protein